MYNVFDHSVLLLQLLKSVHLHFVSRVSEIKLNGVMLFIALPSPVFQHTREKSGRHGRSGDVIGRNLRRGAYLLPLAHTVSMVVTSPRD